VTNKSGKVIFEKMLEAGSTDAFDALPPMNVVIGNAKAAKLIYAGKSVDLNLTTNSNVARVTLE
jgi:cytoskeleton protein RodZ